MVTKKDRVYKKYMAKLLRQMDGMNSDEIKEFASKHNQQVYITADDYVDPVLGPIDLRLRAAKRIANRALREGKLEELDSDSGCIVKVELEVYLEDVEDIELLSKEISNISFNAGELRDFRYSVPKLVTFDDEISRKYGVNLDKDMTIEQVQDKIYAKVKNYNSNELRIYCVRTKIRKLPKGDLRDYALNVAERAASHAYKDLHKEQEEV